MILFGYYGVVFWKMWVIVMESLIEGIFFNRGVFYTRKIKDKCISLSIIWCYLRELVNYLYILC